MRSELLSAMRCAMAARYSVALIDDTPGTTTAPCGGGSVIVQAASTAAHAQSAAPRHAARNRKSSERVVMIASLKIGGTPIS